MTDHQKVRDHVSRSYAKAVSRPAPAGCCGGDATAAAVPTQKGEIVKLAGYDQDDLESLPVDAVVNSFGCGNPLAYSEVKAGDVVLDLGSGAGIDILIAAKKVGPEGHVIGIDMTDEMIAKARENIAVSGMTNVEVRKGMIEDLPVDADSVDWVISNCVINLSPEKPEVFAEIARVLRPGGKMLVSDVVADHLPDAFRKNEVLHSRCVGGAISEAEYIAGLEHAGLQNIQVRERIVYTAAQLKGFFMSDLVDADEAVKEWLDSVGQESVAELADALAGTIWSAKFIAEKPPAGR